MPTYTDDTIKSILRSTKVIAMVGASGNEMRPSYFAMKYLLAKGADVKAVTREGKTFVVAAQPEFKLLATNDMGVRDTFNASPVVADGRLFLRSNKHLYCIDE